MSRFVNCVDINGNNYEIAVGDLAWRPSAYGIVIKDGAVLLSKQFGKYDLPGGGVDLGEDLKDGVIREVKEETGIDVINPSIIGVENSFFHASHSNGKSYHSILIYYSCKYNGGALSTDGFDTHEKEYAEMAEWIKLESVDSIEIASSVDFRPYIKKAAQMIDNVTSHNIS
jgi:8-oxo-dGTP diphosphatase